MPDGPSSMPVVSSTFTLGHAQKDGRHYITEYHTLDTSEVITREYGPVDDEADYEVTMTAFAASLEAEELAQAVAGALSARVEAAREKVGAVLAEAERTGAITKEELELAGRAFRAVEVTRG